MKSGRKIAELVRIDGQWELSDPFGETIDRSGIVILASGSNLPFAQVQGLTLTPVKGQTSLVTETPTSSALRKIIQYDGYLLPARDGKHLIGATYDRLADSTQPEDDANQINLNQLHHHVPAMAPEFGSAQSAHAAVRMTSNNRQPYVGPVPDCEFLIAHFPDLHRRSMQAEKSFHCSHPGLYLSIAHGSRGFTNAALCAELLAALIQGEPLPVSTPMYHSLHPARQVVRNLQRGKHQKASS